jgi:hypothetical protein
VQARLFSARMFSNKICHNITASIYFRNLRGLVESGSLGTSDGRYFRLSLTSRAHR